MPLTQTGQLKNNITGCGPDGLAEASFGTVTANSTSAVTVADTGYATGDVVQFGNKDFAGTPGIPYLFAGTTGVGFQIKSSSSDTGTYNWIRFRPVAQST